MEVHTIINSIDNTLSDPPFVREGGSLLMMVGLPGSGKSSVVEHLQALIPAVVISTDGVRAYIRQNPTYTASEMARVYEVSYALIEQRLQQGQRVIFDASNYLAARRQRVMQMAAACGAPVATCLVQASQDIIRQRLWRRIRGYRRESDLSDADWSVYKWMVEAQEPVVGPHIILDTTATPPITLAIQLYEYWLQVEAGAASNPDLQSPGWASKLNGYD